MLSPARYCSFVLLLLASPLVAAPVDYAAQIQPLLAKNCSECHGAAKQKLGLRLETGALILKGSVNGPVVIAGKSTESKIIRALRGEGDLERMPPTGPLSEVEIKLIARWIDEGAIVPK